jgi:hypothetical protein
MNSDRVIPGQVVSADSDDDTTPKPQETFLHKVASGPFTSFRSSGSSGASGVNGSYSDDDTEVISATQADTPARADTADTGPIATGPIDTDTADDDTTDASAADVETADADTADTDVTVVDAVAIEVAETDATAEDSTDTAEDSTDAAETDTDTPAARSTDSKVAASDEPLLGEAAGHVREEWRLVQASFVDDPRASVAAAAGVVADAAARLESLLRERQRSLRGSWDGNGQADTETLRQLMLTYRRLLTKLIS